MMLFFSILSLQAQRFVVFSSSLFLCCFNLDWVLQFQLSVPLCPQMSNIWRQSWLTWCPKRKTTSLPDGQTRHPPNWFGLSLLLDGCLPHNEIIRNEIIDFIGSNLQASVTKKQFLTSDFQPRWTNKFTHLFYRGDVQSNHLLHDVSPNK